MKYIFLIIALFVFSNIIAQPSAAYFFQPVQSWTGSKKDGKFYTGRGVMTFKDGSTFEGEVAPANLGTDVAWNLRLVKGTYTYKSHPEYEKYIGTFGSNYQFAGKKFEYAAGVLPSGFGKVWYKNGDVYTGYFDLGVPWGYGTTIKKDGTVISGYYHAGKIQWGTVKDKNGKYIETITQEE